MNNSLRKLVQKSNLQTKSDFEIILNQNILIGGISLANVSCNPNRTCSPPDKICGNDSPNPKLDLK
jgi:hypothetical protein